MTVIDLNCDVGEISREIDDAMLPFVSSCNVCCGAHAGNAELMTGTIRKAIQQGVAVGAHPSWPDRKNFGRRSMNLTLGKLRDSLQKQIEVAITTTESLGGALRHVKPHGALYHDVISDQPLAEMFVNVVQQIDSKLKIYGQANSSLADVCARQQLRFVHEAFADRRYENQTTLRSRMHDDAVLKDETEVREHLRQLLDGKVTDVHGQAHSLNVQTICLHSDTPGAISFARLAHDLLKERHVRLAAP